MRMTWGLAGAEDCAAAGRADRHATTSASVIRMRALYTPRWEHPQQASVASPAHRRQCAGPEVWVRPEHLEGRHVRESRRRSITKAPWGLGAPRRNRVSRCARSGAEPIDQPPRIPVLPSPGGASGPREREAVLAPHMCCSCGAASVMAPGACKNRVGRFSVTSRPGSAGPRAQHHLHRRGGDHGVELISRAGVK